MNVVLAFYLWVHLVFNVAMVTFVDDIIGIEVSCVECSLRIDFKTVFGFEFFDTFVIELAVVVNLNLFFAAVHDDSDGNHSFDVRDLILF